VIITDPAQPTVGLHLKPFATPTNIIIQTLILGLIFFDISYSVILFFLVFLTCKSVKCLQMQRQLKVHFTKPKAKPKILRMFNENSRLDDDWRNGCTRYSFATATAQRIRFWTIGLMLKLIQPLSNLLQKTNDMNDLRHSFVPVENPSRYGVTSQNCDVLRETGLKENSTKNRSPFLLSPAPY